MYEYRGKTATLKLLSNTGYSSSPLKEMEHGGLTMRKGRKVSRKVVRMHTCTCGSLLMLCNEITVISSQFGVYSSNTAGSGHPKPPVVYPSTVASKGAFPRRTFLVLAPTWSSRHLSGAAKLLISQCTRKGVLTASEKCDSVEKMPRVQLSFFNSLCIWKGPGGHGSLLHQCSHYWGDAPGVSVQACRKGVETIRHDLAVDVILRSAMQVSATLATICVPLRGIACPYQMQPTAPRSSMLLQVTHARSLLHVTLLTKSAFPSDKLTHSSPSQHPPNSCTNECKAAAQTDSLSVHRACPKGGLSKNRKCNDLRIGKPKEEWICCSVTLQLLPVPRIQAHRLVRRKTLGARQVTWISTKVQPHRPLTTADKKSPGCWAKECCHNLYNTLLLSLQGHLVPDLQL